MSGLQALTAGRANACHEKDRAATAGEARYEVQQGSSGCRIIRGGVVAVVDVFDGVLSNIFG